jgi:hypothetical protein
LNIGWLGALQEVPSALRIDIHECEAAGMILHGKTGELDALNDRVDALEDASEGLRSRHVAGAGAYVQPLEAALYTTVISTQGDDGEPSAGELSHEGGAQKACGAGDQNSRPVVVTDTHRLTSR